MEMGSAAITIILATERLEYIRDIATDDEALSVLRGTIDAQIELLLETHGGATDLDNFHRPDEPYLTLQAVALARAIVGGTVHASDI